MEIISAAVMLFLIMDPLGNLPVMLSILRHIEPKRRRVIMVRELLIALVILLMFLFGGQKMLNFLHVSSETVSISGGIILFLIGLTPKIILKKCVCGWEASKFNALERALNSVYILNEYNNSEGRKFTA